MAPVTYTKLVANKLRTGQALGHDLTVHGKSLPEKVAEALGAPDLACCLEQLLTGAGAAREKADTELALADTTYLAELSDDTAHRRLRDDSVAHLYSTATGARAIVEAVFDRHQSREVGFLSDTPRDGPSLLRLSSVLVKNLPGLPPPPTGSRVSVDVGGLIQDVRDAAGRAQEAMNAYQADQRENEDAIRNRNSRLGEAERTQKFLAAILLACAEVIDDDDLAHRFRSSIAQPTSRAGSLPEGEGEPETEIVEEPMVATGRGS